MEANLQKMYMIQAGLFINDKTEADSNVSIRRDFMLNPNINVDTKYLLPLIIYKMDGKPFTESLFVQLYLESKHQQKQFAVTKAKNLLAQLVKKELVFEVYMDIAKAGEQHAI